MNASLFNVHAREEGVSRAFYNDCTDALRVSWCLITLANESTETWRGWEAQWLQYLPIEQSCPNPGH